jgi:hypothetical protein
MIVTIGAEMPRPQTIGVAHSGRLRSLQLCRRANLNLLTHHSAFHQNGLSIECHSLERSA